MAKGLGTGLGALFGSAAIDPLANDFVYLPISKVEPRQGQPRTDFDEAALQELAESIREHGVLQPLTVRDLGGGFYQIIAGERRWRAARLAGLTEIPARVIEADEQKATELALVENLQREDLNPVEEALGYKTLVDEYGLTQEEVARRVGKTRPVVANAMRLLALPASVLDMLKSGEISVGAARALLALEDPEAIEQAAAEVVRTGMSVREVERLVKRIKSESARPKRRKKDDAILDYVAELEERLTKTLGRRAKIVYGPKKGKIEIEYYDQDDFERLYALLAGLGALSEGEKKQ
ncbi:MAG: ParB/RepB/Spo0J family partition protein [Clostridiales bacterium]|nr:ParB/RepB/Spo0J family partition protein [Clostridiales bacterium]